MRIGVDRDRHQQLRGGLKSDIDHADGLPKLQIRHVRLEYKGRHRRWWCVITRYGTMNK